MKAPHVYRQYDSPWSNQDYSAPGEKTDIRESGCGPTCAASLITTIRDIVVTPAMTARWALTHGYKAPHQGTYYSYFKPQFAEYGIECEQIAMQNNYGKHDLVIQALAQSLLSSGYYLIACVGPSRWTHGGHFVVVYEWTNSFVYIMDPASSLASRERGKPSEFLPAIKYLWKVDSRGMNTELKEAIRQEVSEEVIKQTALGWSKLEDVPDWAREYVEWALNNPQPVPLIQGDEKGKWSVTPQELKMLKWMYLFHKEAKE